MAIKLVKRFIGKIVYYDTEQMDVQGCSVARSVGPNGDTM